MTEEQIREKLKMLHEQENEINRKIAKADLVIKSKQKEIVKYAKQVSKNMLHRNKLIELLKEAE